VSITDCAQESLVNAYYNSIAYTDHMLVLSLAWLQRQKEHHDPSLLYVSDHGESLGEKGLYLHGMPFTVAPRAQTHVPRAMWLPSQTVAADRLDLGCLRGRLDDELSHDHLFHTLLGMARVSATEYRRELDVLAPCRRG
jgi:lipid A ethanolaminephosphotransferase